MDTRLDTATRMAISLVAPTVHMKSAREKKKIYIYIVTVIVITTTTIIIIIIIILLVVVAAVVVAVAVLCNKSDAVNTTIFIIKRYFLYI
jgi:hypothetical protein